MNRMAKVNEQIKREVGLIIQQELSDNRFQFVSIMSVDVSKDLRSARVFFSVLGDVSQGQNIAKLLNKARGVIRRELGRRITMRNTPELNFIFDDSLQSGIRIEETLKEIQDEQN